MMDHVKLQFWWDAWKNWLATTMRMPTRQAIANTPEDIYGVNYVDCDGLCLNDLDGDGVCDQEEVEAAPTAMQ